MAAVWFMIAPNLPEMKWASSPCCMNTRMGEEMWESPLERTVVVVDKTKPEVSLIGDSMIIHEGGSAFVDPGANWTDNIDGNGTVYSTDMVNDKKPGVYTLNYSYVDAGGNGANIARTVMVQDTTLPQLILLGDAEIRLPVWHQFIDPWVEAYDAVDGNIS